LQRHITDPNYSYVLKNVIAWIAFFSAKRKIKLKKELWEATEIVNYAQS
jgi:hypothetical protein